MYLPGAICAHLHILYTLLPNSLLENAVDMGVPKEKRPNLDPPHSKRSRDGAHTVSCDLDAKIVVASQMEPDIYEVC